MKYYKPTEAELDLLSELNSDASKAYAAMAFCLGIVVEVILGLALATGLSAATQAGAVVFGVAALAGAIKFWIDGSAKRQRGASQLQRIKDSHDFANF